MQVENESDVKIINHENYDNYVNEKMGFDPEAAAQAEADKIAAQQAEIAAKAKQEEEDPVLTLEEHKEVPKEKKNRLQERFSELTSKRKEAEERAAKALGEAQKLRDEAAAARKLAEDLKSKYEPVKQISDDEPRPTDFTDINEYSKALKDWTAETTLKKRAQEEAEIKAISAQEKANQDWNERKAAAKKDLPDYKEVINSVADKNVQDAIQLAVWDSEIGPQLLYHLAKNPDLVDKLNQMTPVRALREMGKLELELSPKAANKNATEISKAPAPINPLSKASTPVTSLRGSQEVPATMDYEQWKEARKAGRIK
jgi:hypothetical protein